MQMLKNRVYIDRKCKYLDTLVVTTLWHDFSRFLRL